MTALSASVLKLKIHPPGLFMTLFELMNSALPASTVNEIPRTAMVPSPAHETEQVLPDGTGGTIRCHFDDREVARTVLAEHRAPAPPTRAKHLSIAKSSSAHSARRTPTTGKERWARQRRQG